MESSCKTHVLSNQVILSFDSYDCSIMKKLNSKFTWNYTSLIYAKNKHLIFRFNHALYLTIESKFLKEISN